MKRLLGIFISVFAVFLMSHNASAATRLGGYTSYTSNISGFPSNGVIVNNRDYPITATQSDFYLANGNWVNPYSWEEGKEYHLSLAIVLSGSGIASVVPEGINISGSNYRTESDTITSSVSCTTQTCKYIVIHDLVLVGIGNGSEQVKTPSSNILNAHSSGNTVANFTMAVYLYDNEDEWREWRDSTSQKLNNISNNTSDTVDILDQIYDRLDVLDSNADANAQAWDNMQNTDGLVDTGDTTQLLSIVGVITTVFDQIKNAPMSESCSIDANFSRLFGDANTSFNMGAINLCHTLPGWVADIGGFVMTTITFVAVLFMLIGCVNAINNYMDWLRRN